MTVDAGQHIRLLTRVIGQMNIPYQELDEAYSQGMVALTEAAISYDPERQTPLASWLAKNIRWNLLTWRSKLLPTIPITPSLQLQKPESFSSSQLKEVVRLAETLLTYNERQVVMLSALGFKGIEIATRLGLTSVAVSRLKKSGQQKLRKVYREYE